jgi:hypothetical protein
MTQEETVNNTYDTPHCVHEWRPNGIATVQAKDIICPHIAFASAVCLKCGQINIVEKTVK